MGKYDPLYNRLSAVPSDEFQVTLTFGEIEGILGAVLPASAHKYPDAWWGNESSSASHTQARAWLAAGWRVEAVDPVQGWVRFVRG